MVKLGLSLDLNPESICYDVQPLCASVWWDSLVEHGFGVG